MSRAPYTAGGISPEAGGSATNSGAPLWNVLGALALAGIACIGPELGAWRGMTDVLASEAAKRET